ncbi:hypothetical protein [Mycobacteroides abscessus]|uniref:hypothetical protein n=1 Tax=Mycobacteroides abscessus TaxID=36809 RepID=UPI0005E613DA|nr:hypothetical protein [Mycobacteroides abscessus]CPW92753.1 Uncharacterised protein [Mycobacteroides abscessus]SKF40999.1 Uncharacterised protein [Mycobacteroides abscessus subsp. bolletii]SKH18987.1 Uncharacterised protein [Mycobacteroides abscessus subsp. bolletii]
MDDRYDQIREELRHAESATAAESLPHLRTAVDLASQLIDEHMAEAVIGGQLSIRAAGAQVGLTENSVGPRLARTPQLNPYARGDGRVTASEINRARYDREAGIPAPALPESQPEPLRFKPRRNNTQPKETK